MGKILNVQQNRFIHNELLFMHKQEELQYTAHLFVFSCLSLLLKSKKTKKEKMQTQPINTACTRLRLTLK